MSAEVERVIDEIYVSWLDYSGNKNKQKKHPSRAEYGAIIKHLQLWNTAVKALEAQHETETH